MTALSMLAANVHLVGQIARQRDLEELRRRNGRRSAWPAARPEPGLANPPLAGRPGHARRSAELAPEPRRALPRDGNNPNPA